MNTKKFINLIETKRYEIVKLSESCFRKTKDGSCSQGQNIGIIINEDGNIHTFCRDSNSKTFDELEGKSLAVISWLVTNELPEFEITSHSMTESEIEGFKNWLVEEKIIDIADIDNWENHLDYFNLSDYDNSIFERLELENLDIDVMLVYRETAEYEIDKKIERLEIINEFEEKEKDKEKELKLFVFGNYERIKMNGEKLDIFEKPLLLNFNEVLELDIMKHFKSYVEKELCLEYDYLSISELSDLMSEFTECSENVRLYNFNKQINASNFKKALIGNYKEYQIFVLRGDIEELACDLGEILDGCIEFEWNGGKDGYYNILNMNQYFNHKNYNYCRKILDKLSTRINEFLEKYNIEECELWQ